MSPFSRSVRSACAEISHVDPTFHFTPTTLRSRDAASSSAVSLVVITLLSCGCGDEIVTSRLGGDRLRVAGTAEFNGENRDIRADRIQPLVDWTRSLFPDVDTGKVVPWSGLRPMMPDMMPRVGAGRRPGVFYNTGHGHLGWTLSAATAQVISEKIALAMPIDMPAVELRAAA